MTKVTRVRRLIFNVLFLYYIITYDYRLGSDRIIPEIRGSEKFTANPAWATSLFKQALCVSLFSTLWL